jgi:hypothetical protein
MRSWICPNQQKQLALEISSSDKLLSRDLVRIWAYPQLHTVELKWSIHVGFVLCHPRRHLHLSLLFFHSAYLILRLPAFTRGRWVKRRRRAESKMRTVLLFTAKRFRPGDNHWPGRERRIINPAVAVSTGTKSRDNELFTLLDSSDERHVMSGSLGNLPCSWFPSQWRKI